MSVNQLNKILSFLKEQRGFDFLGYRTSMLERRIQKRVFNTNSNNFEDYFKYISKHPNELNRLIDVLTINVSSFFRNPLVFEFLNMKIKTELIQTKGKVNDNILRIWSAGCSFGEEPYSIAIILNELNRTEGISIQSKIFATDIDKNALERASEGIYNMNHICEVKHNVFNKYFTKVEEQNKLSSEIKNMVKFSFHDLLDKKHKVPPESIFGGFDIVLCRNVLIYFEPAYQKIIFKKLYNSLNKNGYLVLGESEVPAKEYKHKLLRENINCKIYRKVG